MNRGVHDGRGSRLPGHWDTSVARPDSGRGNIVPRYAGELQRHHGATRNVDRRRGPQIGRSLIDRITMDHGGQCTQGRGRVSAHSTALARMVAASYGGGASVSLEQVMQGRLQDGGHASRVPVGNHPKLHPLSDRVTAARGGGSRGAPAPLSDAGNKQKLPPAVYNTVFDKSSASSTARDIDQDVTVKVTRRSRISHSSTSDRGNKAPKRKPGRVTKSKDPFKGIQNAKLRDILKGVRPRAPRKRTDGPLLRMGQISQGIQGYELVCSSPPHGDPDAE